MEENRKRGKENIGKRKNRAQELLALMENPVIIDRISK